MGAQYWVDSRICVEWPSEITKYFIIIVIRGKLWTQDLTEPNQKSC